MALASGPDASAGAGAEAGAVAACACAGAGVAVLLLSLMGLAMPPLYPSQSLVQSEEVSPYPRYAHYS